MPYFDENDEYGLYEDEFDFDLEEVLEEDTTPMLDELYDDDDDDIDVEDIDLDTILDDVDVEGV